MATKKKFFIQFFRLIPSIVWMLVIFHFSSGSTSGFAPTSNFRFYIFKFFHLAEYFLLFILFFYFYRNYKYALISTYLYSMTDEIHQTYVSGREGCLRDTFIDLFGALIGLFFIKIISSRFPKLFS